MRCLTVYEVRFTFSVLAYMKYVVSWVDTSNAFRLLVFCSADFTVMHELRSILPCGVSYSDWDGTDQGSRVRASVHQGSKRSACAAPARTCATVTSERELFLTFTINITISGSVC